MERLGGRISRNAAAVRRHRAVRELDDCILLRSRRISVPVARGRARDSREQRSEDEHQSDCDGTCTRSMCRHNLVSSDSEPRELAMTGCASATKALRQIGLQECVLSSYDNESRKSCQPQRRGNLMRAEMMLDAHGIILGHAMNLDHDAGSPIILRCL